MLRPLPDELLSSWFNRHAGFYGVTGGRLLRHCCLEAASLRDLDLKLTLPDQRRLACVFRYDPRAIRKMTQSRGQGHATGLIATVRPMQVCRRCMSRHRMETVTRGAQLRSWMEGWRIRCPICGTPMEDARLFRASRPAEFRRQPLSERCVKLSLHTAPSGERARHADPPVSEEARLVPDQPL